MVACKKKNNLPKGFAYRKVDSYTVGDYPNAHLYHLSHACNHCEDPACVKVCPTGAMYKDENDGTVQHKDDVCIGCGSCVIGCPYKAPAIIPELGIAMKCNGCIDTREEDGAPVCVASCGTRALEFGDYDELKKAHPNAIDKIACMPSADITHPSILINARDYALENDYRQLTL